MWRFSFFFIVYTLHTALWINDFSNLSIIFHRRLLWLWTVSFVIFSECNRSTWARGCWWCCCCCCLWFVSCSLIWCVRLNDSHIKIEYVSQWLSHGRRTHTHTHTHTHSKLFVRDIILCIFIQIYLSIYPLDLESFVISFYIFIYTIFCVCRCRCQPFSPFVRFDCLCSVSTSAPIPVWVLHSTIYHII